MTRPKPPRSPAPPWADWLRVALGIAITTVIVVFAMGPVLPQVAGRISEGGFAPGFDGALLARQPWVIKLHIASATAALLLGVAQMARPKGVGLHRALGWSWALAMATTAASSLWITGLGGDHWSLIHLLSGWVLVALPIALYAARRGHARTHGRFMTGLFWGGLVFTGLLTFIPGRLMSEIFFPV